MLSSSSGLSQGSSLTINNLTVTSTLTMGASGSIVTGSNGIAGASGTPVPFPQGLQVNTSKAVYLNGATETIGIFNNAGVMSLFGATSYSFDNKVVSTGDLDLGSSALTYTAGVIHLNTPVIVGTNQSLTMGLNVALSLGGSGTFSVAALAIDSRNSPTVSSGFGTSPSVPNANGTVAFTVNVGTGGVATSGVIAMNATAAHGWVLHVENLSTRSSTVFQTKQTATSTTTATIGNFNTAGAAAAWAASDILAITAIAY